MQFVQVFAISNKDNSSKKNCKITGWQNVNEIINFYEIWGGFEREIPRNYLVYRAQIFRCNWNCYPPSIFRNFFFFLTLSDYDKPILMRQICK